jgi:hypothetical protein
MNRGLSPLVDRMALMRPRPSAGTARTAPTARIIAPPNAPVKRARGTALRGHTYSRRRLQCTDMYAQFRRKTWQGYELGLVNVLSDEFSRATHDGGWHQPLSARPTFGNYSAARSRASRIATASIPLRSATRGSRSHGITVRSEPVSRKEILGFRGRRSLGRSKCRRLRSHENARKTGLD